MAKRPVGHPPVCGKDYIEDKYLTDRHKLTPLVIPPTMINFKGMDIDEPQVCSHFGCSKHLSLEELRFGSKCVHHQKVPKIDVTKFISHPIKQTA